MVKFAYILSYLNFTCVIPKKGKDNDKNTKSPINYDYDIGDSLKQKHMETHEL